MSLSLVVHAPMRARSSAVLLALMLAVSACGGGGGGSSSGGGSSVTPPPASVQAPAITAQPAAQTVAVGQSATFTVAATGDGLGYQWQRDGKDIAGATASSYVLNNVQASDDGASFKVVVRNSAGSVTSAAAVLKVGGAKGLSLLAGGLGGPGTLDGADGRLIRPAVIAMSPAGLLYVAEDTNGYSDPDTRRTVDVATGAVATVKGASAPGELIAMVFDGAGNRYELNLTAIYKITPAGESRLLAGAGLTGNVDGTGANARFGRATGMAIDGEGNLYVSDDGNKTLRKVTAAGEVSTLAGTPGTDDLVDGRGSAAHFRSLSSITVDRPGNVYVRDLSTLRKITRDGMVTSYQLKAADQSGPVDFGAFASIAADGVGNIYVADSNLGCRIRRIAADGTVTDFAGKAGSFGSTDGKGDAARFCVNYSSLLSNLALDSAGNLYVGDASHRANGPYVGNQTIRRITPAADVSTVAGRAAQVANVDGAGPAARFALGPDLVPSWGLFNLDYELAADASGNVYVGERDRIRKVSTAGVVSTLPTPPGAAADTVYYGSGLAFDGSRLAVSNGVISRIDANGTLHFLAGQAGVKGLADGTGAKASFFAPNELIMDGLGNVYLKDVELHSPNLDPLPTRILERRISPDGTVTTLPQGLYQGLAWYAGKDGTVWVAKSDGSVVRVAPDGKSTVVRGIPTGSRRGVPSAITVDRSGNLYVAELVATAATGNLNTGSIVSKITPAGVESIVAGSEASLGVRLGAPGSLSSVHALAAGEDGSIYLMSENAVLRLVL